jgi:hypothetical protein
MCLFGVNLYEVTDSGGYAPSGSVRGRLGNWPSYLDGCFM